MYIASHLKQLQILVENKHSWYIDCNTGIHKKDKKIVLVLCSITYLFLIFCSFCSNPSEVKCSRHMKTIISLIAVCSYQTILEYLKTVLSDNCLSLCSSFSLLFQQF